MPCARKYFNDVLFGFFHGESGAPTTDFHAQWGLSALNDGVRWLNPVQRSLSSNAPRERVLVLRIVNSMDVYDKAKLATKATSVILKGDLWGRPVGADGGYNTRHANFRPFLAFLNGE